MPAPRDAAAPPPQGSRRRVSRARGSLSASALGPEEASRVVRERAAANGTSRVSLKGRALASPAALRAVLEAILALDGASPSGRAGPEWGPTTTLNLASANVCGEGAEALAAFLLHPRCALRELSLVDNPRIGVHLPETGAPAHAVERGPDDPVLDGGGCAHLASALRSPRCRLRRLNLGGCAVDDAAASTLADAIAAPGACPDLASLNLRSNDVGYAGAVDLKRAVMTHGLALGDVALANNPKCPEDARREVEDVAASNGRTSLVREMVVSCGGGAEEGGEGGVRVPGDDTNPGDGTNPGDDTHTPGDDGAGVPRASEGYTSSAASETGYCSFRRRGLADADAAAIAAALPRVPLKGLDLSDNALTRVGIDAVASALRGPAGNRTLVHCSVGGNPGARSDRKRGDGGASVDDASPSLSSEDPSSEPSGTPPSVAARELAGLVAANALRNAGRGEALRSVADRGLGDAGAVVLAEALIAERVRSFARLEAVGAQHNFLGPRGASALARALGGLASLRELAMYANPGAGPALGLELARQMRQPGRFSRLAILDVGGTRCGDAAAEALADACACHPAMRELHLDHDELTDRAALAVLGAMKLTRERSMGLAKALRPPGLRRVWLHGNAGVSDEVLAEVHACCAETEERDPEEQRYGAEEGEHFDDDLLVRSEEGDGKKKLHERESPRALASAEAAVSAAANAEARAAYAKHPAGGSLGENKTRDVRVSALFADRVAAHVAECYRRRCASHRDASRGVAVVAGVVAHERARSDEEGVFLEERWSDERGSERGSDRGAEKSFEKTFDSTGSDERFRVVSLGVGTKFVPRAVVLAARARGATRFAKIVRDSHAEVLARRAFRNALVAEMEELVREEIEQERKASRVGPRHVSDPEAEKTALEDKPWRVLERAGHGEGFRVRRGVSLHLFVSTAPCGAASAVESGKTPVPTKYADGASSVSEDKNSDEKTTEATKKISGPPGEYGSNDEGPSALGSFDVGWVPGLPPPPQKKIYRAFTFSSERVLNLDADDVAYAETFERVDERHARGAYVTGDLSHAAMVKSSAAESSSQPAPGCEYARSVVPRTSSSNPRDSSKSALRRVRDAVGTTLSCSDKIARWQAVGCQGALLALFIPDPIAFDSIVVGRKFDAHKVRAATCCKTRGFEHAAFGLAAPKHCAALETRIKCEGAAKSGSKIADKRRADAGDGDECLTWARGDANVEAHDGRTGGAVGGGGAAPAVSGFKHFEKVRALAAKLAGRPDIVAGSETMRRVAEAHEAHDAKKLSARYNHARRALEEGPVKPGTPLARWRGEF